MLNSQNISRRNLFRLSRSVACALGLSLVALPNAAQAEELPGNVNDAGEYTFVPAESLTPDELPPETEARSRSLSKGAKVVNLGGKDRYETVAKEALYAFPSSSTAVVTSGVGYADSIAVSGLAGALGCPILLTNSTYVPDATLGALSSMGVKKTVLIGSEKVASSAVMSKLRAYGSVERIWGPDRYATQMAVYEYGAKKGLWNKSTTAIVASATDFADALSASPVAYALKAPVFFCDSSKNLPSKQVSALESDLTSVKNFLLLGSPEVTSLSTERFLERLASARGGSSVRLGGCGIGSNLELLQAVRKARPKDFIIYKEHPDVVSGNRNGAMRDADVAGLADAVVRHASISLLYACCHEVHTLTSQSGFEALLRGLPVFTCGGPFYAGWGLTTDRLQFPRRRTLDSVDTLVAAVLLRYPVYYDWENCCVTDCAAFLEKLKSRLKG